jgi:hypothetical protein
MPSCPHCQRNYTRKTYFDRHVGVCEFLCKSKKAQKLELEEREALPTLRDLYQVVMELVVKNKELEAKIQAMSNVTHFQMKKLPLTDWLNATYPAATDYAVWFNDIQVTRAHLQIFFDSDYVNGVVQALKQTLPLANEQRPLRAFTNKDNVFYWYNEADKKWLQMDNALYLKLMHAYDKKFLVAFGNWQRENKEKLYSDEFAVTLNNYMKKMMATREPLYSRIKKELYQHLRTTQPLEKVEPNF